MNLRKPCDHGMWDAHYDYDAVRFSDRTCPGGHFATLDDLIAAIDGLGVKGKVRVSYIGPAQPPVEIDGRDVDLEARDLSIAAFPERWQRISARVRPDADPDVVWSDE